MNRNNLLAHLALATAIILAAAFIGQVRRWRNEWKPAPVVREVLELETTPVAAKGAEVLVRFKPDTTRGSESIVVAVLDSGVDYTHQDLVENMWHRPAEVAEYSDRELGTIDDINGFNAVDNLRDPMDDNGHGTHCAGIIGAEGGNGFGISGVNWHVQ